MIFTITKTICHRPKSTVSIRVGILLKGKTWETPSVKRRLLHIEPTMLHHKPRPSNKRWMSRSHEHNWLTIHDDTSNLVMKGTTTKNQLYNMSLKIGSFYTQASMIGVKNFAGQDLQRVEMKDDKPNMSQNLFEDPI
ncbi:hypothetical protein E3N88_01366 [Mikania micrantha]|uniref:Uncharacterized protein n=1 Tax=Mikania micrantha TaxID=192012 RepID=A0A5N6Q3G8_9ASTR|nr:hypothetical protein E3N88_01366 [Mikania micrantha]